MFIRLFIKTSETDKAIMVVNEILKLINEDNIKFKDFKTEPYWKISDVTVAEIKLELVRPLSDDKMKEFLNSISNKWVYFGEEETLSSATMENCNFNYSLEMVNILF